jgi:hypothetical protein
MVKKMSSSAIIIKRYSFSEIKVLFDSVVNFEFKMFKDEKSRNPQSITRKKRDHDEYLDRLLAIISP